MASTLVWSVTARTTKDPGMSIFGSSAWMAVGKTERLTYFSEYPGYKASNPVVSDDGRFMAFQMARSREEAGVGHGIFLFDFKNVR